MYQLSPLGFSYDDLEPYIDTKTVNIHYTKHHQGYVNSLNNVLKKYPNFDYSTPISDIIKNIDKFEMEDRDDILFYAGGVLNHDLYWNSVSGNKKNIPVLKIKEAIIEEYNSYDSFKKEFIEEATKLQGSGYTFLVMNRLGKLDIINTSNQDNPLSYGFIPLIALDLWEHAYYLKYQNRRNEYILNFFEIIDFEKINKLYEEEIKNL